MKPDSWMDPHTVLKRIGLIRRQLADPARAPQQVDDLGLPSIAALLREAAHYVDESDAVYSSLVLPTTRDQASTFSLDLILIQAEDALQTYLTNKGKKGGGKESNHLPDGQSSRDEVPGSGGMHGSLESGSEDSSSRQPPRYRTGSPRMKESCVVPGGRSAWKSDFP
jgi:hypothetical protein